MITNCLGGFEVVIFLLTIWMKISQKLEKPGIQFYLSAAWQFVHLFHDLGLFQL